MVHIQLTFKPCNTLTVFLLQLHNFTPYFLQELDFHKRSVILYELHLIRRGMIIRIFEFSREGYKIGKIFE